MQALVGDRADRNEHAPDDDVDHRLFRPRHRPRRTHSGRRHWLTLIVIAASSSTPQITCGILHQDEAGDRGLLGLNRRRGWSASGCELPPSPMNALPDAPRHPPWTAAPLKNCSSAIPGRQAAPPPRRPCRESDRAPSNCALQAHRLGWRNRLAAGRIAPCKVPAASTIAARFQMRAAETNDHRNGSYQGREMTCERESIGCRARLRNGIRRLDAPAQAADYTMKLGTFRRPRTPSTSSPGW